MEAILSFIPVPVAVILMAAGFISLAVGGIRLGYKATVKDLALELVEKAELSIICLLYTSPSPRDGLLSRMPSSA